MFPFNHCCLSFLQDGDNDSSLDEDGKTKFKRRPRPEPLIIPPPKPSTFIPPSVYSSISTFQSNLRSPVRLPENPLTLPPYTPPPILSPVREGSGLYFSTLMANIAVSNQILPPPPTPKSATRSLLRSSKFPVVTVTLRFFIFLRSSKELFFCLFVWVFQRVQKSHPRSCHWSLMPHLLAWSREYHLKLTAKRTCFVFLKLVSCLWSPLFFSYAAVSILGNITRQRFQICRIRPPPSLTSTKLTWFGSLWKTPSWNTVTKRAVSVSLHIPSRGCSVTCHLWAFLSLSFFFHHLFAPSGGADEHGLLQCAQRWRNKPGAGFALFTWMWRWFPCKYKLVNFLKCGLHWRPDQKALTPTDQHTQVIVNIWMTEMSNSDLVNEWFTLCDAGFKVTLERLMLQDPVFPRDHHLAGYHYSGQCWL